MKLRAWVLVLAMLSLAAAPAGAHQGEDHSIRPRKIVIVSMPSVTWEDAAAGLAPNLTRLGRRWSMGAVSIRTVGSRTDQSSALASIGAGNRSRADGARPMITGDFQGAPNALERPGGALAVRGMRNLIADNRRLEFGAEPGTLGQQLRAMGLKTAVIGNSDGGVLYPTAQVRKGVGRDRRRFGALALADRRGLVDHGQVGDQFAVADQATLNGYRTDSGALVAAARRLLERSDVALIELADAYREGLIAFTRLPDAPETSDAEVAARDRAVRRDDATLGAVLPAVDLTKDALIVVSTAGLGPSQPERLGAVVMAGVGSHRGGWATSAVTLRKGLVTISDIGPAVLRLAGAHQPPSMSGRPMHAVAAGDAGRLPRLLAVQDNALFHGQWIGAFYSLFVAAQALLYLLAWRRIRSGRGPSTAWLRGFCLFFMAVPAAVLTLVALRPQRLGPAGPALVVLALCGLLVLLALRGPWNRVASGPPAFITAVTLIVIGADLLTGSHLQLSSLVGYSPIVAGRFYGLGNLSFALLATATMLTAALVGTRWKRWGIWAAAAIGAFSLIVDGFHRFGADFGGVVALVPALGFLLLSLSGRRMSWSKAAALGIAALGLALMAGWLDSMRGVDEQTHLGRFVERILELGPQAVGQIIWRKAQASWWLLTRSVLTLSIPIALVFLALLLRRPDGKLKLALETEPGLRLGLVGAGIVNVLGFAVNDSGIAIPAMGLAMAVSYCLATLLALPETGTAS